MSTNTQNHIHLDLTHTGADNAPAFKFAVIGYHPIPVLFQDVRRSVTGSVRAHSLYNYSDGTLVQLKNWNLLLRLTTGRALDTYWNPFTGSIDTYVKALLDMNGRFVWFIENNHCADGVDHTPYRKSYLLNVKELKPFSVALDTYDIPIELTDNSL